MKYLYNLLLFIFICSCKNELSDVRTLDYNNSPITIAKSINSVYTDSGIVSSKLISPKMYNFSNKDFPYFEFPESVEIILLDDDKNESIITADYVISYNNTDLVDLRTNVIIITSSKDTLYTDQLYYNKNDNWLFTNYPFKYKSIDKNITGVGFDSNIDFSKINFLEVNGYVILEE
jgi:LPS export ABC transporter protein LptC